MSAVRAYSQPDVRAVLDDAADESGRQRIGWAKFTHYAAAADAAADAADAAADDAADADDDAGDAGDADDDADATLTAGLTVPSSHEVAS